MHDEESTEPVPYSQYPWHGIIPNSCCGIKPYNSDIRYLYLQYMIYRISSMMEKMNNSLRCCDPVTQKLHSRCHDFDDDEEQAEGIAMDHIDHRTEEQIESDSGNFPNI